MKRVTVPPLKQTNASAKKESVKIEQIEIIRVVDSAESLALTEF